MPDVAASIRPMTVAPAPVLILRRSEVAALMSPAAYLAAAEAAFRGYANGDASVPVPMHIPVQNGGFHVKGALLVSDRAYVAVKLNGNFPGNPQRNGLPTIQGVVLLCDATDGSLLAMIDSIEITLGRTAAASALAARYLAREDAGSIAVCGCGEQGRAQVRALAEIASVRSIRAWDIDIERAREFARQMHDALGLPVIAVPTVRDATWESDIVVTATSAQRAFLTAECVSPGTFVAAIGADSPHKNELAAELFAGSKVVVDVLPQCVVMGDLHHAIDAGLITPAAVHAELGDLVIGRKPGRTNSEEITLFDSTGVAIQDVASAAWVYQRAMASNVGTFIPLGAP
jgi:alanine dehydrogenase